MLRRQLFIAGASLAFMPVLVIEDKTPEFSPEDINLSEPVNTEGSPVYFPTHSQKIKTKRRTK